MTMIAAFVIFSVPGGGLVAQGVTTAGIRGSVATSANRAAIIRISARNESTGFSADVQSNSGRFFLQGLEPGGPYTLLIRSVGAVPERLTGIYLSLGETREIEIRLRPVETQLDTVRIIASLGNRRANRRDDGGTGMTITSAFLDHLPTLNRDLYDFLRLVPQISTKISLSNPGMSAGGAGFRFNDFLINGVSERTLSGGVSSAFAGGRSIPIDAVKEYQVILAPYDVRYGDFTGAIVNTITKSGSNSPHGTAFIFARDDRLSRASTDNLSSYKKVQYGFSAGGPIVKNRLHFFVSPGIQYFTFPALGPYTGQPASARRAVPVNDADIGRFTAIMRERGLTAGSAGAVENRNPLQNVFARLDLALPEVRSRLALWSNYTQAVDAALSRTARDTFSLSSYQVTRQSTARAVSLQLHTALPRNGGGHNELLVSGRSDRLASRGDVEQPIVRVAVPSISGGSITLNSGTHETAQGPAVRSTSISVRDNLTIEVGQDHLVTVGADAEHFRLRRGGTALTYGTWSFASLDDLEAGTADRYDVRIAFGDVDAPLEGNQYAAFMNDEWKPRPRVRVTGGVRADLLSLSSRAPYNQLVESIFSRRTDAMPRARVEVSPRAGLVWDVTGTGAHVLRGGVGVFAGRYPLGWAHAPLLAYGSGGVLTCNRLGPGRGPPPAFSSNHLAPPTACAGGSTVTEAQPGDVNLIDPNFRINRVLRTSAAYDRQLPWDIVFTGEGMFTWGLSDAMFVNMNLGAPVATDIRGRVIYGTISANGTASTPQLSAFPEVIDLRNTSQNHSYQISALIERRAKASGFGGQLSYTYSRTRDVQTPIRVNNRGTATWGSATVMSGRHDEPRAGISSNDIPHRVVAAATYAKEWMRGRTELSVYYVGESGRPFTYTASGILGRGDLNADRSNANDPLYVPTDALDVTELALSGVSDSAGANNSPSEQATRIALQRAAFERFVRGSECMRRQRGRILERNSCREPWSNTTVASVRHAFPVGRRSLEAHLEVFNLLNLINSDWGLWREAVPGLLEHVGQTTGTAQSSQPVFRFNAATAAWSTTSDKSAFQLQLALRVRY